MIEVRNLVKKYGNHYAVNNLSFHLEAGKIYGLLGPNGAGKSTTMNMITGYISSTSGDVIIHGHNILTEPEAAKSCIGYLPEIPPLYTEMTIWEYLLTVCELKKVPRKERKEMIDIVMETVKITNMRNRMIKYLSKGYKQRVGIAQALIGFPEIIILDEPTVGLDPKQIIEIRDLVKSLGQKHTVILSSHILSEINAVCDEIIIINKGQLITIDTTENLKHMSVDQNHLELLVEGTEDQINEVLSGIEHVQNFELTASEEESGAYLISIHSKQGMDIRRELFYTFARAQMPILRLQSSSITLEDIFLDLTQKQEEEAK